MSDEMSRMRLMALMLGYYDFGGGPKRERPVKPCLNCGKPKKHNNVFCSAECCKAHKQSKSPK